MDIHELRSRYFSVIYVASCALNGTSPDMEGMPAAGVFNYAERHSIGALVASALESAGAAPPEASSAKLKSVRKIMLFEAARAEIISRFEEEKIKYMPLKGIILKDMYPSIGQRQMSDNDILIDPSDRKRVRDIMVSLGYTVESYAKHHHDVYLKEPVYNFEIHVSLFSITNDRFSKYFSKAFEKAKHIDASEYGYAMSDEDFYIYVKAHEYKHYRSGGIGLRALADTYVFIKSKSASLDFDYINCECEKLGIGEYEQLSRSLATKLFSADALDSLRKREIQLSEDELNMFDYIASSGTYGKISTEIDNAMKRYEEQNVSGFAAKIRFLWNRVFPPMSFYKENAPFVYKYKVFILFYCIGRLIGALLRQPARIFAQLKGVIKYRK